MTARGIHTDNLYEITQAFPLEMFSCPGDVHYTKMGYERIGDAVSQCIVEQLTKRSSATR